jgi:hypothetical protein
MAPQAGLLAHSFWRENASNPAKALARYIRDHAAPMQIAIARASSSASFIASDNVTPVKPGPTAARIIRSMLPAFAGMIAASAIATAEICGHLMTDRAADRSQSLAVDMPYNILC